MTIPSPAGIGQVAAAVAPPVGGLIGHGCPHDLRRERSGTLDATWTDDRPCELLPVRRLDDPAYDGVVPGADRFFGLASGIEECAA